jgi:hypothetical protein
MDCSPFCLMETFGPARVIETIGFVPQNAPLGRFGVQTQTVNEEPYAAVP